MISRRLLRIKALIAFYAFNRKKGDNLDEAEKELQFGIKKSYDLYHFLLLLVIEIVDVADDKIEIARNKKIATEEDLNPNTRLIDNRLVKQLRENRALRNYRNTSKLEWNSFSEIPKTYYNNLIKWDAYSEYMNSDSESYSVDKKFIIKVFGELLRKSESLENALEELSIYWNDDLDFTSAMVEKTLRQFKETSTADHALMTMYRSDADEAFVKSLLRKSILHFDENNAIIDHNTTNWEIERIALMDTLVMQLAITEIIEFPEIPVKVTLNEYIEIAKYYCTSKSSTFVNGILDKIVREMRKKSKFKKIGRGLIGEPGFDDKK